MLMPISHVGACRLPEQVRELPHIHFPATHNSPSVSHIISSQGFRVVVVVANFVAVSGAPAIVVAATVHQWHFIMKFKSYYQNLHYVILFLHYHYLFIYSLPFLQKIQSLPDKAVGSDSLFKWHFISMLLCSNDRHSSSPLHLWAHSALVKSRFPPKSLPNPGRSPIKSS